MTVQSNSIGSDSKMYQETITLIPVKVHGLRNCISKDGTPGAKLMKLMESFNNALLSELLYFIQIQTDTNKQEFQCSAKVCIRNC